MPAASAYVSLLGRFAAFYEEVARIKLAAHNDDLGRLLQPDSPHTALTPHDLAARVSARLLDVLDRQGREVADTATEAEMAVYRRARYVMVALADEILILDLAWAGSDHWPEHLLEYTVAHTRIAGRRFFDEVQALIDARTPTPMDVDLAAVLLLALQLGFQGRYRGAAGKPVLAAYRAKLYKIASAGDLGLSRAHAFAQAYQHTVVDDRDNSRIALMPWVRAAVYGALGYLVVSTLLWLWLTMSLLDVIARAADTAS